MVHLRDRFLRLLILKQAKLWPIVGVLGPRQSGKSTLLRELLKLGPCYNLDDLELREEAIHSPKTFLGRITPPIIIDEIQKAPPLFDALKLNVDQKKIPGKYFITGSSKFSAKTDIRESLTGRIGLTEIYPMTLAELSQNSFLPKSTLVPQIQKNEKKCRYSISDVSHYLEKGGMPVPAFLRDPHQREAYWRSWLETSLIRDVGLNFGSSYDSDFSFQLLIKMAQIYKEGELPTLKHFKYPAAKVRKYLNAMENIFLVKKIHCHELGIGKEVWILMDSGLLAYLMKEVKGEGSVLSLARHFLWNEWATQMEYQGQKMIRTYYKSAHGSIVDFVFYGVPMKVVARANQIQKKLSIEERSLRGAMKKLQSKRGFIIAPIDTYIHPDSNDGVGVIPWSYWS